MNAEPASDAEHRLVISLCGTFLKPEMQSIYRQVTGLKRFRTKVYTEKTENLSMFPFEPLTVLEKIDRPRLRGNFILRFWYKYVVRQWPPPIVINKEVRPYYPYDLPDRLREDQPALVHVYYGHKAVKYLPMIEAWGGPFVVSFHGVDVVKFMDQPGYPEAMRRMMNQAKLVLARSQSLLDVLRERGCPPEKLRLNRTPIPFPDNAEVRTAPVDGAWKLVQACRLIEKKGIFTVLAALREVVKVWPDLHYTLCGKGPLEEAIRQRVEELDLIRNVTLAGWMDQQSLQREYLASHVFLHPSETTAGQDQEGVPNSMLEAMAGGLPVVATQHGGIPEAVANEETGLLVPEKSPADLSAALLRLLGDPDLLRRLSHQAATQTRASYGAPASLAKLEDAYAEAIAAPVP